MKKYKSKLDKEKKKKREMDEDLDYLKQVEKPGGRKFVVDKIKDEEQKEKDRIANIASGLQSDAKVTYHTRLAAYGQAGLETLDWPTGWEGYCFPTNGSDVRIYGKQFKTRVGIQVIIRDNNGFIYARGVLTTMNPIIDMKNVDTLVVQAENTIDSAKGLLLSDNKDTYSSLRKIRETREIKKTKGGIYLPN